MKRAMRKSMDTRNWESYYNCKENGTEQEFNLVYEHATPSRVKDVYKEGMFSFCFVRHPVSWYKSYWAFVSEHHVPVELPIDNAWDDNYEQFMITVLDRYAGFVSKMFQMYELESMNYVGKQESLVDDLIAALSLAGEKFDEDIIKRMRKHNETSPEFINKAVLSKELEDRIIESEQWAIGEFYD